MWVATIIQMQRKLPRRCARVRRSTQRWPVSSSSKDRRSGVALRLSLHTVGSASAERAPPFPALSQAHSKKALSRRSARPFRSAKAEPTAGDRRERIALISHISDFLFWIADAAAPQMPSGDESRKFVPHVVIAGRLKIGSSRATSNQRGSRNHR